METHEELAYKIIRNIYTSIITGTFDKKDCELILKEPDNDLFYALFESAAAEQIVDWVKDAHISLKDSIAIALEVGKQLDEMCGGDGVFNKQEKEDAED